MPEKTGNHSDEGRSRLRPFECTFLLPHQCIAHSCCAFFLSSNTMFATVAARAVSSIFTNAMTTRFTPPASCKTHWTYEAPYYNSVSNGILVQNQVKYEQGGIDTDCFPSGWRAGGRAYSIQVWSPGACPVSYTTVTEISDSGTTTGVCCYSYVSIFLISIYC